MKTRKVSAQQGTFSLMYVPLFISLSTPQPVEVVPSLMCGMKHCPHVLHRFALIRAPPTRFLSFSNQLLGKDLVVWKNTEGTWATFDDRCPHRAAPLTEGRVEKDGSLM